MDRSKWFEEGEGVGAWTWAPCVITHTFNHLNLSPDLGYLNSCHTYSSKSKLPTDPSTSLRLLKRVNEWRKPV